MNLSRLDVPQSVAACSRVSIKPEVLSEVMGWQSKPDVHRWSVSTRVPANQSSRGPVARLDSEPARSGAAPRASSVTETRHQCPKSWHLRYSLHSQSASARG